MLVEGENICVYIFATDLATKLKEVEKIVVEMTSFVSCPGGLLTRNCSMRKEHLSLPK